MTEDDLLAAMRAEPDSVGPRLVFADWLQTQGEPIGEAIALAIERGTVAEGDPRAPAILARLKELGDHWWERFRHYSICVEHGMPAELTLRVHQLTDELLPRLRGTFIRELAVDDGKLAPAGLAVLVQAVTRMHLRKLRVEAYVVEDDLAALLAHCPALEELRLGPTILDDDDARIIATAALPSLARVTLIGYGPEHCPLGDGGAEAFAATRAPLRALALQRWRIGPRGAATLVDGRLDLRELDLSGNPLGPAGVIALARGAGTARLESLAIAGVGLDDAAVTALAQTPALAGLKRLVLAESTLESGLASAGLAALVASPILSPDLELAIDGGALGLRASGSSDWSEWEGDPPAELARRFRIKVAGWPGR